MMSTTFRRPVAHGHLWITFADVGPEWHYRTHVRVRRCGRSHRLSSPKTSVTVLYQDIGDGWGGLGGDTSTRRLKVGQLLVEGKTDWRTVALIITRTALLDGGLIAQLDQSMVQRISDWQCHPLVSYKVEVATTARKCECPSPSALCLSLIHI